MLGAPFVIYQMLLEYEIAKNWLSDHLHLTHHDLHVILGLGLTFLFGRLMRLPLGSWRPLLIVFALEMINEGFDFARYRADDYPWTPWPALIDIALTIGPPFVILLAARWQSPDFYRFRRRPQHRITVPMPDEPRIGSS